MFKLQQFLLMFCPSDLFQAHKTVNCAREPNHEDIWGFNTEIHVF